MQEQKDEVTLEELGEEFDLQEDVAGKLAALKQDVEDIRKGYVDVMNMYLEGMTKKAEADIADPESQPHQIAAAKNVLMNADLINNSEKILEMVDISGVKRLNSLRLTDEREMRSLYRRNRIVGLHYQKVMQTIDSIKDAEFREKMICMFNTVNLFAKNCANPKEYAVFVKFAFMIMRTNSRLGLIPVLGGKAYEIFKKV
jgi:hypothetical protein